MIKINKQLTRPDTGKVSSGSIIDYNSKFIGNGKIVMFDLSHYVSQTAIDENKPKISKVIDFNYKLNRVCTDDEWTALFTDAGAGALVEGWLHELLEGLCGVGNTEII